MEDRGVLRIEGLNIQELWAESPGGEKQEVRLEKWGLGVWVGSHKGP